MKKRPVKKAALIENSIIFALLVLIGIVAYFRHIKNKTLKIQIKSPSEIHLISFNGASVDFNEIVSKDEEVYLVILKIDACPGSILRSFEEALHLRAKGHKVVFVTVHNWFNEWKAWIGNFDLPSDSLYMMKKEELSTHFGMVTLPIILRLKNYKIKAYKTIH